MTKSESVELLPCPFCGKTPDGPVEGIGSPTPDRSQPLLHDEDPTNDS